MTADCKLALKVEVAKVAEELNTVDGSVTWFAVTKIRSVRGFIFIIPEELPRE